MAEDALGNLVTQIRKYLELARRVFRRWWIIVLFTLAGAGGSVTVALLSTHIFQSRALVAWKQNIDVQSIGWEASSSTLPQHFLRQKVNQLTASNTLLLKIANDLDLFPGERGNVAPELILEAMRSAISFNMVGSDSFWIAFEYKDPGKAQHVTARLVHEFILQNVSDKLRAARSTQGFMEQEAAKVLRQVEEIESKLARFVSEHPEFLTDPVTGMPRGLMQPQGRSSGSMAARILRIANIRNNPELKAALDRKGKLEAELLQHSPRGDGRMARSQEELIAARRSLAALKQKYTDRHPDVQRAMIYLRQLQQQTDTARQAHSVSSAKAQGIRRQIAELDAEIVRLSRPSAVRRPAGREEKIPQRDEASQDLSAQAQSEKTWYELTRDRTVVRAKYEQIQTQLQRSKLAAGIEQKQAEKEFSIVDQASLPGKPIRPSRKKIVMAGTALGIMIGLGLAALLVLFDPRIYNEDDLRRACNLPVLAQIPKEP